VSIGLLRGSAALITLSFVLASAACSDKPEPVPLGDPSASSTGASASPSAGPRTTTVGNVTITLPADTDAREDAVFAGYQAFWQALLKASAKANPQEPILVATTTGNARPFFVQYLGNLQITRRTQSGPVRLHPTAPSLRGSAATLTDCADLSRLVIRSANGKPVGPPDPKTTQIRIELALQGAKWLVKSYDETARGCRPPIA